LQSISFPAEISAGCGPVRLAFVRIVRGVNASAALNAASTKHNRHCN